LPLAFCIGGRGWDYPTFYIMGNTTYKKKHRELGLCQDCSSPAQTRGYCLRHYWNRIIRDRRYISEHKEEHNAKVKQWRMDNFLAGKCTECAAPLINDEVKRCVNCK